MPYSGNPASSPADALRFYLQDTSTSAATAVLNDGEVAFLLARRGNDPLRGAILGAISLAARYSATANAKSKSVGPFSISGGDPAEHYRSLAAQLSAELAGSQGVIVYSGGISRADKALNQTDTDWDKPWFRRGLHDHPIGSVPIDRDERNWPT